MEHHIACQMSQSSHLPAVRIPAQKHIVPRCRSLSEWSRKENRTLAQEGLTRNLALVCRFEYLPCASFLLHPSLGYHEAKFLQCCTYINQHSSCLHLHSAADPQSAPSTQHDTARKRIHDVWMGEAVPHSSSRFGVLRPHVPAALEVER